MSAHPNLRDEQAPCRRGLSASLLLAVVLWPALASSSAAQVVGDADGDGQFDHRDVTFLQTLIRHRSLRPYPMADVAAPCTGVPDPADGLWLQGAWMLTRQARVPVSECHGQPVGSPSSPPPSPPPWVTLDDHFLAIARQVPEFGGLYVAGEELHVVLTDASPTVLHQAALAIEEVFGRNRFAGLDVRPVPGEHTFEQLAAWKRAAAPLLAAGRVVSLDADERRNRLRLGIEDLGESEAILALCSTLGIPAAAVELWPDRVTAPLAANPLIDGLRSQIRPLRGGINIGIAGSNCTLGFLAKWYGVARGLVTASHCLPGIGQEVFVDVFQDEFNTGTDDHIGVEAVDPPLQCGGTCRLSDAVFVALDDDETGLMGRIAGSPQSPPAPPYFGSYQVVGTGEAVCGEIVHRVGTRTGEAAAEVESTCVGVQADWSSDPGSPAIGHLPCQHRFDSKGETGDSGGPVFRRLGSDHVELVGLHWGGTPAPRDSFSPLSNIEAELGDLAVAISNELPEIRITQPHSGAHVGSGALVPVHLEAAVFDFEQGGSCSGCTVAWASTADGALGLGPFDQGTTELDTLLTGGTHTRVVTADAQDDQGATSWDFVIVHTDNLPPQLWIDWPDPWATLWTGVPYTLQGSSFDSESFQPLPCSVLQWSIPGALPGPVSGCFPAVVFPSPGLYAVTLQGTDSLGATAGTSIPVQVVSAPANAPPAVTFLAPAPTSQLPPGAATQLVVVVTAPGGAQNPIALDWVLESAATLDPSGSVSLGSETVLSGAQPWIEVVPQDVLQSGCGAVPFIVRVTATDLSSQQAGQATLDLAALWPPC